ncbi:MAG: hypothetical protein RQ722_06740 [Desulfuromonadales bacterium]|nr:hypothetical protein [Desulfuromonadales bacterium]
MANQFPRKSTHRDKRLISGIVAGAILVFTLSVSICRADEPALPGGLEQGNSAEASSDPTLPSGLGAEDQQTEPGLPSGLDGQQEIRLETAKRSHKAGWALPEELSGYVELRGGLRLQDDPVHDDITLMEARWQLSYDKYMPEFLPRGNFRVTGDLIFDAEESDRENVDLEEGAGFFDLRELWLSASPLDFLDIKAGRQILTWGTGNLLFLNDLFPKDYQSFFLGRRIDYLKAPSDAVKASFYANLANVDVVYTPRFDADRFVDGSRLSLYDPSLNRLRGEDQPLQTDRPDEWFKTDEIALRIYRNIAAYELALYGYRGYWKSPTGTDLASGKRIFPALAVWGASMRGPAGAGIGNLEFSWYDSLDDSQGDDPLVQNSEWRFLAGYEQEVATDLTVGLQYYLEYMIDYRAYKDNLPTGFPARKQDRHWLTLELTQELMAQNQLVLSLFTFYDLSVDDWYFRPQATYDISDRWQAQIGANIFVGGRDTFFGQFEKNSNGYFALRLSF